MILVLSVLAVQTHGGRYVVLWKGANTESEDADIGGQQSPMVVQMQSSSVDEANAHNLWDYLVEQFLPSVWIAGDLSSVTRSVEACDELEDLHYASPESMLQRVACKRFHAAMADTQALSDDERDYSSRFFSEDDDDLEDIRDQRSSQAKVVVSADLDPITHEYENVEVIPAVFNEVKLSPEWREDGDEMQDDVMDEQQEQDRYEDYFFDRAFDHLTVYDNLERVAVMQPHPGMVQPAASVQAQPAVTAGHVASSSPFYTADGNFNYGFIVLLLLAMASVAIVVGMATSWIQWRSFGRRRPTTTYVNNPLLQTPLIDDFAYVEHADQYVHAPKPF